MSSQYYRNLEDFCLEEFKQRLATEEVMPARQVLKEDLDERFQVLENMGITNLQELIDTLRTKKRVAAFAQQSGLPHDYLVILGREARSYVPKPVYFREISGLDPDHVARLDAVDSQGHEDTRGPRAIVAKRTAWPESGRCVELPGRSEGLHPSGLQTDPAHAPVGGNGQQMVENRPPDTAPPCLRSRVHRLQLGMVIVQLLDGSETEQLAAIAKADERHRRVEEPV